MLVHSRSHDADYTMISLQTALHLAAHTKQHDMLRKLLVSDASLHLTDHKGNTPLHIICRFNSTKCLEEILKFVKLNTILEVSQIRNNEGQTCIHIAAQQGNTNALRKLRCIGVDINMQVCQKCGSVCLLWVVYIPYTCIHMGGITQRNCTSFLLLPRGGRYALISRN